MLATVPKLCKAFGKINQGMRKGYQTPENATGNRLPSGRNKNLYDRWKENQPRRRENQPRI